MTYFYDGTKAGFLTAFLAAFSDNEARLCCGFGASAQLTLGENPISVITEEEKAYLESLFPDAPTFSFGHPDRLDTTKQAVTECYRSQYGISWRNARTGLWSGLKFQIIEV